MFKRITAMFLAIITVLCVMSGCKVQKVKSDPTPTPVQNEETGNKVEISSAGFDLSAIKTGDKVSVFTVKSADVKKQADGAISSAKITFTGEMSVRGQYAVKDGKCEFSFADEYTKLLPFPNTVSDGLKSFGLDVNKISAVYGDAEEGYASVIVKEYTLSYSVEDGEWQAFADDFAKDENEYAVMQ